MKKITFLKVLAYPASAYILLGAAQPVLAETQEDPVPETTVDQQNDIQFEEEAVPAAVEETVTVSETETETPEQFAYNDAFAQYVEEQFIGKTEEEIVQTPIFMLFKASISGDNLSATDHEIYEILKPQLEAVAKGDQIFTKFVIDASSVSSMTPEYYTAEDLYVPTLFDDEGMISFDAAASYYSKVDLNFRKIYTSLEQDMPSQLYWFDKTYSGTYFPVPTYNTRGDKNDPDFAIQLKSMSFNFAVSKDYQDTSYDDVYHVDKKYGQSVQKALNNARDIVTKYADLDDYEKIKAYVKELTDLSEYNTPASEGQHPYGDPWQIIWLFDGDPETKVVCEGYAKGFQYLCEMSTFQSEDLKVISVHGISGSGLGAGAHEWNIVHMPDGKNYVVDVTNSAKDAIGGNGELILAGTEKGNIDKGYIFAIGEDNFPLQYNEDTRNIFTDSQLLLSQFNYQPVNTMRVAVKVNDYQLVEGETINYEILLDPGKASVSDVFYDVTFRVPDNPEQTMKGIQDTTFSSTAREGDYSVTVRAYDNHGNEATVTRLFTVAPAISVKLIGDHALETYVDTGFVLTADATGGFTPYQYQFEVFRNEKWDVLQIFSDQDTCMVHSRTPGSIPYRVVAKDGNGHTAVSQALNITFWGDEKPDITVEDQYYKVGDEIDLAEAIHVPQGRKVVYYAQITDNATGKKISSIPNDSQNDYLVEYTFVDDLDRLVGRELAKVYVLNSVTFNVPEINVLTNTSVNLLDGVIVTDSYGKEYTADSNSFHVAQITGPKTVKTADKVKLPAKGTYTVKYSFKDSLGLDWTYDAQVHAHAPIDIQCDDFYHPVNYDINLLEGVKGIDENGNEVDVVVASIKNEAGKVIKKIDTSLVGTYTVTYSAVDAFGLKTTKTASVHVKEPPVIFGEKTVIPVNWEGDLLDGMSAVDDQGNELTVELVSIQDADGNVLEEWFTDTPQILTVTYTAKDKDGVYTDLKTELRIKERPSIVASDVEFYHGQEFHIEDVIFALDADNHKIKPLVSPIMDKDGKVVKDWSLLAPGSYIVTITATDKDGLSDSKDILVTVFNNVLPEIFAEDVYLVVGDEWDPWKDVSAKDQEDGDLTDKIEIVSVKKRNTKARMLQSSRVPVDIDTSEPGIYDVVYRVVDRFGGETIKAITVTIVEKTPEEDIPETSAVVPAALTPAAVHGVPTGVHQGLMGYASMMTASLGAISGILKRRKK